MRLQRAIVLILAVFGAGLVGFLVYFFTLEEPEPEQLPQVVVIDPETGEAVPVEEVPPPPPPTTDILTVTRDIATGETLRTGDLAWTPWLDSELSEEHITRPSRPNAIREMTGDIVTAPIFASTHVIAERVLDVSSTNVFASLIAPGNRAVTISVNAVSSVAGLIEHNDRVDVILTRSAAAESDFDEPTSEIVITNARILAVDDSYGQLLDVQSGGVPSTVTLELSPEAAVFLESVRQEGTFSLVLRGTATADEPQTRTAPDRSGGFVRVLRDGVAENIQVRNTAQ